MTITNEQLKDARETLQNMICEIQDLLQAIEYAIDGFVVNGISLSEDQKHILKDQYSNDKSNLVKLYQKLP